MSEQVNASSISSVLEEGEPIRSAVDGPLVPISARGKKYSGTLAEKFQYSLICCCLNVHFTLQSFGNYQCVSLFLVDKNSNDDTHNRK